MGTMTMKMLVMIAICLHLAACGKSKNDSAEVSAAPAGPTLPVPTESVPAPTTDPDPTSGDENESNNGNNQQSGDQVADQTQSTANEQTNSQVGDEGALGSENETSSTVDQNPRTPKKTNPKKTKPAKQSGSATSGSTATTSGSQSNSGPANNNNTVSSNATGSIEEMQKNANKFSGSSADYLRTFLQAKEAAIESSQKKAANLKAAQKVLSASLKIDFNRTGDLALNVNLGTPANKKTINLFGVMKSDRTSILKSSDQKISAKLQCMDIEYADVKSCETALVTMQIESGTVNIIFRRTNMTAKADFGSKQCMTQECEDLYALFRQTELNIRDWKNITVSKLETVEVINGISTFKAIMITRANEVMVIAGNLLNPDVFPVMNQVAQRTLNLQDLIDARGLAGLKDNMHKSMSEVRIVGNNGKGQIQLQVNMKALGNGSRDSFNLQLTRVSKDIKSLSAELP